MRPLPGTRAGRDILFLEVVKSKLQFAVRAFLLEHVWVQDTECLPPKQGNVTGWELGIGQRPVCSIVALLYIYDWWVAFTFGTGQDRPCLALS